MRATPLLVIGIGIPIAADILAVLFVKNLTVLMWIYAGVPLLVYSIIQHIMLRQTKKKLDQIFDEIDATTRRIVTPRRTWRFRLPISRN